jgi:serine/threonine-protein phosphatase 2A regulatory subunit B'
VLCSLSVIELFDSEDPRERDYLKTILHRIYGKFMTYRSYIRKAISNVFYTFIYEEEHKRHNGIGELLEILGSIINGFAIPLKPEHVQFLKRALIPLHKSEALAQYQQQLSYCVVQYVEKDPDTAIEIIRGLIKYWPWLNSGKQVIMVNELEEILEFVGYEQLMVIKDELWRLFKLEIGSTHFQVSERILFLWNNEHLVNQGCLSRQMSESLFPVIYPELNIKCEHWNPTVSKLAQSVVKMFQEFDVAAYEKVVAAGGLDADEEREAGKDERIKNWDIVEKTAEGNRK